MRLPDSFPLDSSLHLTTGGSATPAPALAAISTGYTLTGPRRSFTYVAACRFVSVPGLRTTPPGWWSLRARSSVRFNRPVTRTCRDPDYWGASGLSPGGLLSSPKFRGFRLAQSRVKEWLRDRRQSLSVAAGFPIAVPHELSHSRVTIPFPSHRTFSFPEYGGPTVFIAHHAQVSPHTRACRCQCR